MTARPPALEHPLPSTFEGKPVSFWVAQIRSPSWIDRWEALDALWYLYHGFDVRIDVVGQILPPGHFEAIRARVRHGWLSEKARLLVPVVEPCLDDLEPAVRSYAARILTLFGAEALTAAPALQRRLYDEDPLVQLDAALALHSVYPAAESSALMAGLRLACHKDAMVRRIAAGTIAVLGRNAPIQAQVALRRLASDPETEVRISAEEALHDLLRLSNSGTEK